MGDMHNPASSAVLRRLTRDDAIALLQARPGCTLGVAHETALRKMTQGGLPVCEACTLARVNATTAMAERHWLREYREPTGTLTEELDGTWIEWWMRDLLGLFARRVLDREDSKRVEGGSECFFCVNGPVTDAVCNTAAWRHQVRWYLRFAAGRLRAMYRESEAADRRSGYNNARWIAERSQIGPFVCERCGVFRCAGDESCEWFLGEAHHAEQARKLATQDCLLAMDALGRCACSSRGQAPPSRKRPGASACACPGCHNTPRVGCSQRKCGPCGCTDLDCVCNRQALVSACRKRSYRPRFVRFVHL